MNEINGYQIMRIMRNTLNKLDSRLIDHGDRVAYMVWKIALYDKSLNAHEIRDLTITAFLHDIGAYKTDEIDQMVKFETEDVKEHSIYGYLFLKYLAPLNHHSRIVLCHHIPYNELINYHIPEWKWTQVLTLSDRFDVLMGITHKKEEVFKEIYKKSGTLFSPEVIDLFVRANTEMNFIYEIYESDTELQFDLLTNAPHTAEELRSYLNLITFSIDFRSQYMVTHTMTTNRISLILAKLLQLKKEDVYKIDLGSILHDLGKMAIPIDILDYPGKLSPEKKKIMQTHVIHTADILDHILDQDIVNIAIRHHEKLNGNGYPLGLNADDLNVNERVVAIADIISALYEQRSYKDAFEKEKIFSILHKEVKSGSLDANIIQLALDNFDELMTEVKHQCDPMIQSYKKITSQYQSIRRDMDAYLMKF